MPRGRFWYGRGFWKRSMGWFPGAGGFRGGAYAYSGPTNYLPGWGWEPNFYPGYMPNMPWINEPTPEEEINYLKEQAEIIRAELNEIEKRLADLSKENKNE